MSALERLDLAKLSKVAGMFDSPYDGERAAAAALADRMVRQAGLTWPDLLQTQEAQVAPPYDTRSPAPLSPGQILARHGHALTSWETQFLSSLLRSPRAYSEKQRQVLNRLRQRFGNAE